MVSDAVTRELAAEGSGANAETERLSIDEMLRIMDVASTLRRERTVVDREFAADELKEGLRARLREVAETTGDEVTEGEIEAAIDWYYRNLYVYESPRWSLSLFVAHVWVRRWTVCGWTLFAAAVVFGVWGIWWR